MAGATGAADARDDRGAVGDTPAPGRGDAPDHDLLTLEELAEATGIAARTIRYYQAEKLLQKPARDHKDARVARYGPEHVERLRLVGELRDRGLKLPAIRTLLESGDATTRVADWLGLDTSLRGAWGRETPRLLTDDQLSEAIDGTPPGTKGQLEDGRLVQREGNSWVVPNPSLFDLGVRLVRDGVPIDLVIDAGTILQRHLRAAANDLVELFVGALDEGAGAGNDPPMLVRALEPAAGDAAGIIFRAQLERRIAALLADTKRFGPR